LKEGTKLKGKKTPRTGKKEKTVKTTGGGKYLEMGVQTANKLAWK